MHEVHIDIFDAKLVEGLLQGLGDFEVCGNDGSGAWSAGRSLREGYRTRGSPFRLALGSHTRTPATNFK